MLKPFFEWANTLPFGSMINGNIWAFPLVETFHIWALAVLLGSLFIIDTGLMGLSWGGLTPGRIHRELSKYINISLIFILFSGTLLWLSDTMKSYENAAFWPKMYMLAGAIAFHYTGHKWALRGDGPPPAWGKLAGILSLALWFGVGAAGRAIGFV